MGLRAEPYGLSCGCNCGLVDKKFTLDEKANRFEVMAVVHADRRGVKLSEIGKKSIELVEWLEREVGVTANNSRIKAYSNRAKELSGLIDAHDYDTVNKNIPEYDRALTELHEFLLPFRAFTKPNEIEGLVSLLKRSVGGPDDKYSEGDKRSADRNYFFEVAIGARLHRAGLLAAFPYDSPKYGDVETTVLGRNIKIQCKRLSSERKIEYRCREAMRQLKTNWDERPDSFGFIALDVSKIINVDSKLLIAQSKLHANELFTQYFQDIVDEHIAKLAKIPGFFEERCIGLMLYSSQMYYDSQVECRSYMPAYMVIYFHPGLKLQMEIFDEFYNAIHKSH